MRGVATVGTKARLAPKILRKVMLQFSWADLRKLLTKAKKELDSLFDEIDGIVGIENGFAKASAEHEVGAQDGDEEFGANNTMRGDCNLLKLKPKTGGQGSEDNPLVITDDECHGDGDSESEDDLVWKKRRVDRVSWFKTIGETDEETDDEAEISCTGVRADDTGSESDSIVGRLEDFASASADLVESQPVARVGDNGEWGIHGIIGKEIIDGVLHYCVDWEPTMLPVGVLRGAWRMVQEFEAKEQARSGKGGDSRKRKRVRRGRQ
ncbi:MAG: hypothetical protein M1839_003213 [Geoglossum umbratile]|nr:MAG: hypothetical protein M1839_003213 [Geoglossum umbratile]KAI9854116.1 MAG: hypothetical protein M1813_001559 [Trichoglossum hirsutum]